MAIRIERTQPLCVMEIEIPIKQVKVKVLLGYIPN